MSKHIFTNEQISRFGENPCVLRCSRKSIDYTQDFKVMALEQYKQGVSPREIWRRVGLDTWRSAYPRECMTRWRRISKKKGYGGLKGSSGANSVGRPKTKEVTDADKIKRLELQVKYLRAENDFLAKLRAKRAE
jgi:transposase-like protein